MVDVIGAFFIIVVGSTLHFMYDWTNHNKLVGFFTAVNESTWEHLKLIIAPTFIWMIVEIHLYGHFEMYFIARFVGLIIMISIIPIVFYSYTKISKHPILAIDIGSFVLAASVGQYVFNLINSIRLENIILKHIGMIGLVIVFLRYMTHTYSPDQNFLHVDPITNKYGIEGHYIEPDENINE